MLTLRFVFSVLDIIVVFTVRYFLGMYAYIYTFFSEQTVIVFDDVLYGD